MVKKEVFNVPHGQKQGVAGLEPARRDKKQEKKYIKIRRKKPDDMVKTTLPKPFYNPLRGPISTG